MKHQLERVRKKLWTYRQPLTRVPAREGVPVSDLFLWRNEPEWGTFFELVDICGLFGDAAAEGTRHATLVCFDAKGSACVREQVALLPTSRRTLDLSAFTSGCQGTYGTFAVFHSCTPDVVTNEGSFIAERGYVGYRYGAAPLRGYVHGNLDAIALNPDMSLDMLGPSGLRMREYCVQHELRDAAVYEMAIVNPNPREQRVTCEVFSTQSTKAVEVQEAKMPPRGCHVFRIAAGKSVPARVIVKSRLVMARPLVFRLEDGKMDVFHG